MSLHREQLLGFLLGALEPHEQAAVERELAGNPQLRKELAEIAATMAKLGLNDPPEPIEPPAHLADRTCQFVEAQATSGDAVSLPPDRSEVGETEGYTLTDAVVAAAVLLVLAGLVFPSLANSRFVASVYACQNNLRRVGWAFWDYSELNPTRRYPAYPKESRLALAGVMPTQLVEVGVVSEADVFVCRASPQAVFLPNFPLPTMAQLRSATDEEFNRVRPFLGGSYSYPLGYTVNGQVVPPRNDYREHYCLVADAMPVQVAAASANHAGRGGNFFFEDGHVRWFPKAGYRRLPDDPYCNRHRQLAAGVDSEDSVVGSNDLRPMPAILPAGESAP
jgi:hypothetical protein